MNYPKDCKLHQACAKSPGRYPGMHAVKLETVTEGSMGGPEPRARLIATDGRMIAVVEVEPVETDTPGLIPAAAIKEACRGSESAPAWLDANGRAEVRHQGKDERRSWSRPEGEFPRWEAVLPEPDPHKRLACFSASLLANLAEALGTDTVVLELPEPGPIRRTFTGPILVRVPGHPERRGALMPIQADLPERVELWIHYKGSEGAACGAAPTPADSTLPTSDDPDAVTCPRCRALEERGPEPGESVLQE